jgi:hypothetical protein
MLAKKMEARLSALFESQFEKVQQDMNEKMEKHREKMNEKLEKQRVEIEKQREEIERKMRAESEKQREEIERNMRGEIESLRSVVARHESDNAQLKLYNARLLTDLSEVHTDLRILHPLPYARLHLQKCIDHQILCNDAVNAFISLHTLPVIYSSPPLTLQLQELNRELKKAWNARFAAAFLCEPPPTLDKVLWIVAKNGYTNEVKRCMNLNQATRSCKMLQKVMREVKGKRGLTQLNYFAWKGMISSVNRMLLMKGIDVESRNDNGRTPLINVAHYGHIEIFEILLNHGAKIESMSNKGHTSLYAACQEGHLSTVNLLINKGANLEASSVDGWRPLHTACGKGHLSVVNLLIDKGADIEASSVHGWRPLHTAAQYGHLKIVKALIAKGADMNARINNGESSLDIARLMNHPKIVNFLRTRGAIDDVIDGDDDEDDDSDDDE